MMSPGEIVGVRRSRSTQLFPFATISGGHRQAPLPSGIAGGRHTTGSMHLRPLCTNPDRQTQSVPAALGISGERHVIGVNFTHSLPLRTVPGGQMH